MHSLRRPISADPSYKGGPRKKANHHEGRGLTAYDDASDVSDAPDVPESWTTALTVTDLG
jgi:hypothetical protein